MNVHQRRETVGDANATPLVAFRPSPLAYVRSYSRDETVLTTSEVNPGYYQRERVGYAGTRDHSAQSVTQSPRIARRSVLTSESGLPPPPLLGGPGGPPLLEEDELLLLLLC